MDYDSLYDLDYARFSTQITPDEGKMHVTLEERLMILDLREKQERIRKAEEAEHEVWHPTL